MQAEPIKTKAIVVRAVPYRESDMIVTLIRVDLGRLTATARGCLKPKAKLRYSAEPFNFGEYVLNGRNGKYVITECEQIESFSAITADIERYYAGFAVLDALDKLSGEADPQIFMHAVRTLGELAYNAQKSADRIVTEFLTGVLSITGLDLDFAHCNVCKCDIEDTAYFSDKDGVVCKHCRGFEDIVIENAYRAYISGTDENTPHTLRAQANILLANLVYRMLGVKINTRYFTELI